LCYRLDELAAGRSTIIGVWQLDDRSLVSRPYGDSLTSVLLEHFADAARRRENEYESPYNYGAGSLDKPELEWAHECLGRAEELVRAARQQHLTASPALCMLLAEIAQHPESDHARQVYADALLEHGDAQGELIHLQLAAEPDHDRIDALLAQHGVTWLASLADLTMRAQFQRGFVTRLELGDCKPTAEQLADPALATVEDLLPGRAHHDSYTALITSPAMRGLRRIEVFNDRLVTALEMTRARITHVACTADASDGRPAWFDRLLRVCQQRPELTSITCKLWMLPIVVDSPCFAQLRSITISKRVHEALQLASLGARELVIRQLPALEPCIATPNGAIVLAGDTVYAWGDWGLEKIPPALQYVPSSVKRVELAGEPPDLAQLQRAAALFKLELAILPPRRRSGYVQRRQA
jgi:uncharacterized protein (TIGR02996 family)